MVRRPGHRLAHGAVAARAWALLLAAALLLPACASQYVAGRAGSSLDEDAVVATWPVQPLPWEARLTGFGLTAQPGASWSVDYDLALDLTRWRPEFGRPLEVLVAVTGELRHDTQGWYRSGANTFAVSSEFTTTGIPLERFEGWPRLRALHGHLGSPFEGVAVHPVDPATVARPHALAGTVTVDLPADTPAGWWEPRVYVLLRLADVPDPVHVGEYAYEWNDWAPHVLPLVQVGAAATPRMPWTAFDAYPTHGRRGTLPVDHAGRVGLIGRSGFPSDLVLAPGVYDLQPGLPALFPSASVAMVDGGGSVMPERIDSFARLQEGEVSVTIDGPGGLQGMGTKAFAGDATSVELAGGPFIADFTLPGRYLVEMGGWLGESFGRRFEGGGLYDVTVAMPLSFSTSCKPGTSFLVGDRYPSKVNVTPSFPATVRVEVDWYPDSDPDRRVRWMAEGQANRYGHYVAWGTEPLTFDEPGEYVSRIEARYEDARGMVWLGRQTSSGVVAPVEPEVLALHGTSSWPWDFKRPEGAVRRFKDRPNLSSSFLPNTPYLLQDPFSPFDGADTLVMPTILSEENIIQPKFSMEVRDPELAQTLTDALNRRSVLMLPWNQPASGPWTFLRDVVELSTDSLAHFSTVDGPPQELPIDGVGADGWHPALFAEKRLIDAYVYQGSVRPGLNVLTSAYRNAAKGLYWQASPNRFGDQVNAGLNGDLPGDLYRIAAGAVLKDLRSGDNHYDAYATTVAFIDYDEAPGTTSILAPGERPLRRANLRELFVMTASDTHDAVEVGEKLAIGGVVVPIVQADVTWTVTKPSGEQVLVQGRANRLGVARGKPLVDVDEPGLYRVEPRIEFGGHVGDLPGLVDGSFWHCATPVGAPALLEADLDGITTVDPVQGIRIPIRWPAHLTDVTIHYGLLMPGAVLDQGVVRGEHLDEALWHYPLEPIQWLAQVPNFDARDYATGEWRLWEMVVLQVFIEARDGDQPVYDALRLAMRRDQLFNYRALLGGHR